MINNQSGPARVRLLPVSWPSGRRWSSLSSWTLQEEGGVFASTFATELDYGGGGAASKWLVPACGGAAGGEVQLLMFQPFAMTTDG